VKGVGLNLNPDTKPMIRIVTLAAAAATLIAAPASAADSIRVSTAGKSAEQVRAEVHSAARKLCAREIEGSSFPTYEMDACMRLTVRATFAQAQNPALKLAQK